MNGGKKEISPERADRIYRIHRWVFFFLIAVVPPAIVIAINGYGSVWEVIFLFGISTLLAWAIYWTNWINSVIIAIGVPVIVIAITGYNSVWNVIFLFGICGFLVWSLWFGVWAKKRIFEGFYEDKK